MPKDVCINGEYPPEPPWSKEAEQWWLERNAVPPESPTSSQRSWTTLGNYSPDPEFEPVVETSQEDDDPQDSDEDDAHDSTDNSTAAESSHLMDIGRPNARIITDDKGFLRSEASISDEDSHKRHAALGPPEPEPGVDAWEPHFHMPKQKIKSPSPPDSISGISDDSMTFDQAKDALQRLIDEAAAEHSCVPPPLAVGWSGYSGRHCLQLEESSPRSKSEGPHQEMNSTNATRQTVLKREEIATASGEEADNDTSDDAFTVANLMKRRTHHKQASLQKRRRQL